MKVLIIDDQNDIAGDLAAVLRSEYFLVEEAVHTNWERAGEIACSKLRAVLSIEEVYHAIVLDIKFPNDFIGGVRIYSKILQNRLRGRFKHIVVPTRYFRDPESSGFQATRAFLELAFIPSDNCMPKDTLEDYYRISGRLKELETERNIPVGSFRMWEFA